MQIKVMPDYECSPLWWDEPGRYGNIRPEDIGLSETLAAALWDWASVFDAALNEDDPKFSDFRTEVEKALFNETGLMLTARVAEELGQAARVRFVG